MIGGSFALVLVVALDDRAPADAPVSFFKEIRPLLTAHCAGCHQPAKTSGKVVLTSHDALFASGKQDEPILVAGKPEESLLLDVLLPEGGDPERAPRMPKNRPPLTEREVERIRRWIEQGAHDDTPAAASAKYTAENPPVYSQQPVVTSLDFSPDGRLLAVSGHHEVLLYEVGGRADAAGSVEIETRLAGRLVGLSERIQTARFSPDGTQLLVIGGSPAQLGEIQFWNVAERKLRQSIPLGFDTLYGGSWSPDGRLVAFGGGDHSVRALDVDKGELVFFNAASEDLVLDTAFSRDSTHLVSVGRDRALKLFEVANQQFLDNITSITPGALKGGLMAVDCHPEKDVLLIGGADGTPKTYKMHRTQDRVIGDDFNLVKAYAPMSGRIFAIEWSPDAARFVAGSSASGTGEIRAYALDHESPVWSLATAGAIYAATWRSDGTLVAAGGFEGRILLIEGATGRILASFDAAPVASRKEAA